MAKFKMMLEVDADCGLFDIQDWAAGRSKRPSGSGPCMPYTITKSDVTKIEPPITDIGFGLRIKSTGAGQAQIGIGNYFDHTLNINQTVVDNIVKWAKENMNG